MQEQMRHRLSLWLEEGEIGGGVRVGSWQQIATSESSGPALCRVSVSNSRCNQFLKDPSKTTLGDGYQPKSSEE